MRTRIYWLLILFLIGISAWWLWPTPSEPESVDSTESLHTRTVKNLVPWEDDDGNPIMIPESEVPEEIREEQRKRSEMIKKHDDMWRTPITFYGKVVDQDDKPVDQASIDYSITDMSPDGRTMRKTFSGSDGFFLISGVQGNNMIVRVSKEGYLQPTSSRRGFTYGGMAGGRGIHKPDPQAPEVFRLQRKGEPAALIKFGQDVLLPPDGSLVPYSFLTGGKAKAGKENILLGMRVNLDPVRPDGRHDWEVHLEVPGGGLQLTEHQLPTRAPTSGYLPAFSKSFSPNDVAWQGQWKASFYLKTQEGHFAVVFLHFIPYGDRFVSVQGSYNPDGSNNLQYDANWVIKTKTNRDGSISLTYPKGYDPDSPPP